MEINALMNMVADWGNKTFGADNSPEFILPHLEDEVVELCRKPMDPSEMADVIQLVMQLARYYGVDLNMAMLGKHQINMGRRWAKDPNHGGWRHTQPSKTCICIIWSGGFVHIPGCPVHPEG